MWYCLLCCTPGVHGGSIFECVNDILKMEATEQYFVVVQFVMLHKIVVTLTLWMKSCSVTLIQMKATEQYFPVILFIMLYKVVHTFKSVDEILKCDHSNESY